MAKTSSTVKQRAKTGGNASPSGLQQASAKDLVIQLEGRKHPFLINPDLFELLQATEQAATSPQLSEWASKLSAPALLAHKDKQVCSNVLMI
jgi:hypothetical protein